MVDPYNAPVNQIARPYGMEKRASTLFSAALRESINRGGQKARHEHDEYDTQAKQFDRDVRHEVHRITLGNGPSPI